MCVCVSPYLFFLAAFLCCNVVSSFVCHYRQEVFVMQLVSFYSEVFEKVRMQFSVFICVNTHGTEQRVSRANEEECV